VLCGKIRNSSEEIKGSKAEREREREMAPPTKLPTSMERVKRAIREKIEFIQSKKDELGEKGFRRVLERDLNLPKRALDEEPMKGAIGKLLMRVIETGTVEDDEEEEEEEEETTDEEEEEDFSDSEEAKPKKKKVKAQQQQKKKTGKAETLTKEAPNATVSKLRQMCKDAGITKATHVFMKYKTNEERQTELEKLLGEYDLDIRSSSKDVAKVKAKIERDKDLEDIDASNIIEGGRRRNRTQVSYKGLDASESEEEEEEEEESDVEIESDSEEERKRKKKKQKKTLKKKSSSTKNTSLKKSPKAFTAASSSEDDE
jgi:hypothetical protein